MSVAERLLCPTTGLECSYRAHLDKLYTPIDRVDREHIPTEFNPATDGIKLGTKLAEHNAAARVLGCGGPNDDFSCPTAETMANSRTRTASITVVKTVISFIRGTK